MPALNVAAQCLAVLAAAGALSQPAASIGRRARKSVLVLRDVSASCRKQADRPLALGEEPPVERYDFAAGVWPAGRGGDANRTSPAAALRLAAARGDRLAGVIVQTDGRFTEPAWRAAAAALGRAGPAVTVVPMESPPADVRIADVSARREPGGRVHLGVTVAANALSRRTLRLRRTHPPAAEDLVVRELDLLPGRSASVRATDSPPAGRLASYAAELTPGDTFGENDAAEAVVLPLVQRLAVVGDPPAGPGGSWGIPPERLAPGAAPRTADAWMGWSAVLLADASGTLLPGASRAALEQYVRSGGGLVLVGAGPHGSPADRDDPLNRAAALVANPYQRRPLDLAVVLDASGSMAEPADTPGAVGERRKFDQAVEAVSGLRRHLTAADRLSVITFSDSARRVYDSGAKPIDFASLRESLAAVRPAGPTDVSKAIELAAARTPAEPRDGMVLVVSDLLTRRFRPDLAAEAFRKAGLSLAVVAIGGRGASRPAEMPLETLARLLSAPVVRREGLSGLAKVFAGLLRQRRGDAVRAGRFDAAAVVPVFGRPAGPLPNVTAYVLSAPQPKAEVLARVGPEGDPLLAVRRVGLGRSVCLALPMAAGQNPAWRTPEGGGLIAAAVRWALRPAGDARFSGTLRREGAGLNVVVEASDPNGPMNLLRLGGRIVRPDAGPAEPRAFAFAQTAPGRYEARVRRVASPAWLTVHLAGGRVVWQGAVGRDAGPELAAVGPDWDALRLLAELTGGRIAAGGELAQLAGRLSAQQRMALWPILLGLAAGLMLAEWAGARIWQKRV